MAWLAQVRSLFDRYGTTAIAFNALSLLAIAAGGLTELAFARTWLIVSGVVALAVSGVMGLLREGKLSKLERDLVAANSTAAAATQRAHDRGRGLRALWVHELEDLGQRLGYHSGERISVFRAQDDLVLVARHSQNQNFCAAGRRTYPKNRGCIGRAWAVGRAVTDLAPSSPDIEPWLQSQKDDGLPNDVARRLTMRSRSIVAVRLHDPRGLPIGVIAFESERSLADLRAVSGAKPIMDPDDLEATMRAQEGIRVRNLLEHAPVVYGQDD